MSFSHLIADVDKWHSHETAPKDGTAIIVNEQGVLGVYAWETRPEFLLTNVYGDPMPPTWVGFIVNPKMPLPFDETKSDLMQQRLIPAQGLEEPFQWRPFPAT